MATFSIVSSLYLWDRAQISILFFEKSEWGVFYEAFCSSEVFNDVIGDLCLQMVMLNNAITYSASDLEGNVTD